MFLLQIEALAGFSAIIDRLGEFSEVVESYASPDQGSARDESGNGSSPSQKIEIVDLPTATERNPVDQPLLALQGVTLQIPDGSRTLIDNLNVEVHSASSFSPPAAGPDLNDVRASTLFLDTHRQPQYRGVGSPPLFTQDLKPDKLGNGSRLSQNNVIVDN